MRVIAGEVRGFRLKVPAGTGTRPMTDKVKEALFAVLAALGVAPARVLDLYAGSGGGGIEALSRGAAWADFVEQNGAACAVIRDNLRHTKFTERAAVYQTSVEAFLGRAPAAPYDLVIMDPPYADPRIAENLALLGRSALVAPGAIVVVGHSARLDLPDDLPPLRRLRHRCHGDSCFSVYEVTSDE